MFDNYGINSIDYFSIFNLKSTKHFNFKKLQYKNFVIKKEKPVDYNFSLFVGSCFVETNLLDLDQYLEILKKVVLKEKKIRYILHPREKIKKFKFLKNIEVIDTDYGIEDYLINQKELPNKIISFYSTSLTSISSTLKNFDKIYVIDVEELKINLKFNKYEYDYALSNFNKYNFFKYEL